MPLIWQEDMDYLFKLNNALQSVSIPCWVRLRQRWLFSRRNHCIMGMWWIYSGGKYSFRCESLASLFDFAKSYEIHEKELLQNCNNLGSDSSTVANQDSGDRSQKTSVRQKRDQKIASLLILIVTVFGCCNLVIFMCVRFCVFFLFWIQSIANGILAIYSR